MQKKHEIKTKTLSVQLQKQLYNQENARAYISYKNVENLKISFYKINQKTAQSFVLSQKKNDSLVDLIRAKNKAVQITENSLVDKKLSAKNKKEIALQKKNLLFHYGNTAKPIYRGEGFTVYEAEWWHFDFNDWRKYRIGNQRFEDFEK